MKIVTIGDVHGSDAWKRAPEADITVFIGDYTDHWTRKDKEITDNLLEIIEFKKANPDTVILLLGNHDVQYALQPPGSNNRYFASGYRSIQHYDLYPIFRGNMDLFQIAYQHGDYLWTHAGIHKGWYTFRFQAEVGQDPLMCSIADKLNDLFLMKTDCLFDVGHHRGGFRPVGGPLWLHKHPGRKYLEGYHQIVGHTAVKSISTENTKEGSVTFVDCFEKKEQFYTVNIQDDE